MFSDVSEMPQFAPAWIGKQNAQRMSDSIAQRRLPHLYFQLQASEYKAMISDRQKLQQEQC